MTQQERIEEYLSCNDLEMVNLGVTLMKEVVNRNKWQEILERCSRPPAQEVDWGGYKTTLTSTPRYYFRITKRDIEIWEVGVGIWSQIEHTSYKHTYDVKSFSLGVLTEAIRDFESGKKHYTSKGKQTYHLRTNKIKHK